MLTFKRIYEIYQECGLNNYTINCLNSNDKAKQSWAMKKIKEYNFQTEDDILLYLAMNV